jgi:stearoyl-CoA desaturase (delta-9 desaturase)
MSYAQKYKIFYIAIILSIPTSIVVSIYTSIWYLLFSFLYAKLIAFIFIQIGLHRYFTHNGFETGAVRRVFLTCGSVLTGNNPLSWSAHHLYHHKHSDSINDIHSPKHGWLHTSLLWPLKARSYFFDGKEIGLTPKRLIKDKLLIFIHKNYFLIWSSIILITALVDWKITLFVFLAPAGWSVFQGNFITNFLGHWQLPGSYKNFDTHDNSYNNRWLQFIQIGEGLHNNHHHNMRSYNQAMKPGEWDPAAWIIDCFFKVKT